MKKVITIVLILLAMFLISFYMGDLTFSSFEEDLNLGFIPKRIDHILISCTNIFIGFLLAIITFLLIKE